jgi:hypothetical protein
MASEPLPLDIDDNPELLRLAEEVNATGEPRVLRSRDGELALVTPIAGRRKRRGRNTLPPKTKEQMEAFWSSFGSWKDVDVDKFLDDIYESRKSSRPPVDL